MVLHCVHSKRTVEGNKTVAIRWQQTRWTLQTEWKTQINCCTNYCTKLESLFCTPWDFLREYLNCVLCIVFHKIGKRKGTQCTQYTVDAQYYWIHSQIYLWVKSSACLCISVAYSPLEVFFFIPRANINIKTNNINTLHVESILFFIFSCHTNNCFTRVHQRVTEVSEADGSKHEKKWMLAKVS